MQSLEVSANVFQCELVFFFFSIWGLSFVTGDIPYSNAYFGAGTGPIYLDDVSCALSASQLLECPSRPILTHNCLHSADAGVRCKGK